MKSPKAVPAVLLALLASLWFATAVEAQTRCDAVSYPTQAVTPAPTPQATSAAPFTVSASFTQTTVAYRRGFHPFRAFHNILPRRRACYSTTTTSSSFQTNATSSAVPPLSPGCGFTSWLNSVRAGYGLSPVGDDPNLCAWAAQNNAQQAARGVGHFVMGPARRQNSAVGSYESIGAMWLSSPAHRAALLDPTIRWIGVAGFGAYWTYNAS